MKTVIYFYLKISYLTLITNASIISHCPELIVNYNLITNNTCFGNVEILLLHV